MIAYSTPAARSTGDVVTAAIWNADIRDNFIAGVPDIFTTAGDIVYATAADTAARLGIGVARSILAVNAGATAPEWLGLADPVHGFASSAVTTTTTSATYVDLDSMAVTLTAARAGSDLLAILNLETQHSLNSESSVFALSLDAAAEVQPMRIDINGGTQQSVTVVYLFANVGAGSHTIKGRYKTTGGTVTVDARSLTVMERL